MKIRLKKLDAGTVLSFIRDRGQAAVQRSGHAGFFAHHDLMHYAVETTLGFERAFLGLMAEGWSFEAFANHDDPRYQAIPSEAVLAEQLVDLFTRAYHDRAWLDPELRPVWFEEVARELASIYAQRQAGPPPTLDQVLRICRTFSDLADRWASTPVGGHLELTWPSRPA